jgi:hypothetical protein
VLPELAGLLLQRLHPRRSITEDWIGEATAVRAEEAGLPLAQTPGTAAANQREAARKRLQRGTAAEAVPSSRRHRRHATANSARNRFADSAETGE